MAKEKPQPEPQKAAAPQVETKPCGLNEALEILRELRRLPSSAVNTARIKVAEKTVLELQQGLPVVTVGADQLAKGKRTLEAIRLERLGYQARTNPELAWLLSEYKKLTSKSTK